MKKAIALIENEIRCAGAGADFGIDVFTGFAGMAEQSKKEADQNDWSACVMFSEQIGRPNSREQPGRSDED